jgi:hypothetical protein
VEHGILILRYVNCGRFSWTHTPPQIAAPERPPTNHFAEHRKPLYVAPMKFHALLFVILCALLAAGKALAGGSGLNVIVVVNQNSPNSVQLGNDYCERRGVPPQNLLRLTNWTGGSINWAPGDFTNDLLNPLLAMISRRGLTNQAQFVLLSMDIPYRVTDGNNENSTTAALFYGFKTNGAPVSGYGSCSLPDNTSNSYAYSELPFSQATPNTASTNSFLAMMLTDTNLADAENTLSNGVAADGTYRAMSGLWNLTIRCLKTKSRATMPSPGPIPIRPPSPIFSDCAPDCGILRWRPIPLCRGPSGTRSLRLAGTSWKTAARRR